MNETMALVAALEELAGKVRQLEKKVLAALEDPRDENLYRLLLEEKTALLAEMPKMMREHMQKLPADLAEQSLAALTEMAEDARRAKALGSPFYMSVLLYSAEQRQVDPNDLERLILWLRQKV